MVVIVIQLLHLLQVSDELFVAHQLLCSRLVNQQQQQQQHPSTDLSFIDGHLSNYQTLVSWCIDSVIQVHRLPGFVYLRARCGIVSVASVQCVSLSVRSETEKKTTDLKSICRNCRNRSEFVLR